MGVDRKGQCAQDAVRGAGTSEPHPSLVVEQPHVAVATKDRRALPGGVDAWPAEGILDRVEQRQVFLGGGDRERQIAARERQTHPHQVRHEVLNQLTLTDQLGGQVAVGPLADPQKHFTGLGQRLQRHSLLAYPTTGARNGLQPQHVARWPLQPDAWHLGSLPH
jgi:hypothetical protein